MLKRTTNSPLLACCGIFAAATAGWLLVDAASAQAPKKAHRAADQRLIIAYSLQHVDADQILTVLQESLVDSGGKVSASDKQNMLVVWGSRQVHDRVRGILESIDQPRQDNTQIKIFCLEYSKADDLVKILGVLTDTEKTRISVDARTNSLIVSGTQDDLKILEAIIAKLDEANCERGASRFEAPTTFYVRFVWLASGPDSGDGDDPAEDLKDVLVELAELGIDDVRQVAQTIVNVGMDGQFAVTCQPVYGERPARWTIDGKLEEADEALKLRIQFSATHGAHVVKSDSGITQVAETRLVDLETDLVIPEGHYIVLGITPTGKTQSVFVLQIIPRE
jgi:type II/III secretion system protein